MDSHGSEGFLSDKGRPFSHQRWQEKDPPSHTPCASLSAWPSSVRPEVILRFLTPVGVCSSARGESSGSGGLKVQKFRKKAVGGWETFETFETFLRRVV